MYLRQSTFRFVCVGPRLDNTGTANASLPASITGYVRQPGTTVSAAVAFSGSNCVGDTNTGNLYLGVAATNLATAGDGWQLDLPASTNGLYSKLAADVLEPVAYDALFAGGTTRANVLQWTGTATAGLPITSGTGSGQLSVSGGKIAGIASGGISSSSFAAGAINAAAIASGALWGKGDWLPACAALVAGTSGTKTAFDYQPSGASSLGLADGMEVIVAFATDAALITTSFANFSYISRGTLHSTGGANVPSWISLYDALPANAGVNDLFYILPMGNLPGWGASTIGETNVRQALFGSTNAATVNASGQVDASRVTGSVGAALSIASGGISSSSFAAGAISGPAIVDGALDGKGDWFQCWPTAITITSADAKQVLFLGPSEAIPLGTPVLVGFVNSSLAGIMAPGRVVASESGQDTIRLWTALPSLPQAGDFINIIATSDAIQALTGGTNTIAVDASNRVSLSTPDEAVLDSLAAMISSNAFTTPALANSPAASGTVTVGGYAANLAGGTNLLQTLTNGTNTIQSAVGTQITADHGSGAYGASISGQTIITHNTGGTDNFRVLENGTPVPNAKISCYSTTVYASGSIGPNDVLGQTTTSADGRWAAAISVTPPGSGSLNFTLLIERSGLDQSSTATFTVDSVGTVTVP